VKGSRRPVAIPDPISSDRCLFTQHTVKRGQASLTHTYTHTEREREVVEEEEVEEEEEEEEAEEQQQPQPQQEEEEKEEEEGHTAQGNSSRPYAHPLVAASNAQCVAAADPTRVDVGR